MSEQTPERVVISKQPVADFSHLKSPEERRRHDDQRRDRGRTRRPGGHGPADDIFGRVVETPLPDQTPRLHPSWWRGFSADFAARMVTSTRPARRAA